VFELHHVEERFKRPGRKVSLKSGGYQYRPDGIDDHIASHTGAFVGHRSLEETIFRTNWRPP